MKPNLEGLIAIPISPSQGLHWTHKPKKESITLTKIMILNKFHSEPFSNRIMGGYRDIWPEFFIPHEMWEMLGMKYPAQSPISPVESKIRNAFGLGKGNSLTDSTWEQLSARHMHSFLRNQRFLAISLPPTFSIS